VSRAAGAVARAKALRYDAFEPELAGGQRSRPAGTSVGEVLSVIENSLRQHYAKDHMPPPCGVPSGVAFEVQRRVALRLGAAPFGAGHGPWKP
jgi:hypothetical protein